MTSVSKRFFIGLAIFAVAAIVYLSTSQLKFQDGIELGSERTEDAR